MTEGHDSFDKDYWERHWRRDDAAGSGSMRTNPPNPYLARELEGLAAGTALDAGCGAGAEAIWLAGHGWEVTAADISAEALAVAAERAAASGVGGRVRWVEADLAGWRPDATFDLVMTHYAHPAMPQLEFYERVAEWVAPGGTLLIVGHLSGHGHGHGHGHGQGHSHGHGHGHGHGQGHDDSHAHHPPAEATVTAATITARLNPADWHIHTAGEPTRTLTGPAGREVTLHDVVVRAVRRTEGTGATR